MSTLSNSQLEVELSKWAMRYYKKRYLVESSCLKILELIIAEYVNRYDGTKQFDRHRSNYEIGLRVKILIKYKLNSTQWKIAGKLGMKAQGTLSKIGNGILEFKFRDLDNFCEFAKVDYKKLIRS